MLFVTILDPHTILPLVPAPQSHFSNPQWEEEERFQHFTQYKKLENKSKISGTISKVTILVLVGEGHRQCS